MHSRLSSIPFALAAVLVATTLVAACGLSSLGTGIDVAPEGGGSGGGDASGDTDGESSSADATVFLDSGLGPVDGSLVPDGAYDLPDGAPDPYYSRVTTDLVALYQIEENGGSILHDSMPMPYDMNIATLGDVTWKPHLIQLKNYTKIANSAPFAKLKAACATSNELTVEAWVQYASVTGDSTIFGRLVSAEAQNRDFAMGNKGQQQWWFTMDTGVDILANGANKNLVHTMLVRTNDPNDSIFGYVNGAQVGTETGSTKPKDMTGNPLVFGNSPNGDRGVQGEIHLIAIYSHAFTPAEVMRNYLAGPDPAK